MQHSLVDNFILEYKLFFQPRHGIIFLLKTKKIWHFTNGINGHALLYACVFYVSKKTYAWDLRCQNGLEVYQANVEAKKREGTCIGIIKSMCNVMPTTIPKGGLINVYLGFWGVTCNFCIKFNNMLWMKGWCCNTCIEAAKYCLDLWVGHAILTSKRKYKLVFGWFM